MTTTLRKLISEIDKTKETDVNWEKLANIFNLYNLYYSDDARLKCYFIKKWLCTDTHVGIRCYYLNDEPICISTQTARKDTENFTFFSKQSAIKLKNYLESLIVLEEDYNLDIIEDSFLDEEIPSTYKIEYNSQILHKLAFLNGEKVDIIKTIYPWDDKENYFHTVKIKLPNGKHKEIDCRELDFEYNR